MCGEQAASPLLMVLCRGSPPRVRGTGYGLGDCCTSTRITPACAGNSCWSPLPRKPSRDHPRVCGEQELDGLDFGSLDGSPPRVRGTVINATWEQVVGRITPACAGNRTCLSVGAECLQDHPRVCGEQYYVCMNYLATVGSPPRVRGTGPNAIGRDGKSRITPACAGNRCRY